MTLREKRDQIADGVSGAIPRMQCYAQPPDTIVTPALIVGALKRDGRSTYDPTHRPTFDVLVVVQRTADGWQQLDEFCEPTGDHSVQAALESIDGVSVLEVEQTGAVEIGGTMFYGAVFTSEAWL